MRDMIFLEPIRIYKKNYEDLENNKHDLLVECESHKKYVKTLNDKLVRSDDALRDC